MNLANLSNYFIENNEPQLDSKRDQQHIEPMMMLDEINYINTSNPEERGREHSDEHDFIETGKYLPIFE